MYWCKNDVTAEIAQFANMPLSGWTLMTAEEITAEQLKMAKVTKRETLKNDLNTFCKTGYVYLTWTFKFNDRATGNIAMKDLSPAGMSNRYKYYDKLYILRDFTDSAGFIAFKDAMFTEKDRVMEKYNDYKKQIKDAADMTTLNAITIDFSA